MTDRQGNSSASAEVGGKRLISYDKYLDAQRADLASHRAEIDAAAKRYAEAAAEYQRSLQALPPRVKEEVGHRPSAAPTPMQSGQTQHLEPELTGHNYDGIEEYDNPTPGWWHAMFLGSIAFAICYVVIYHFSPFVSSLPERHARSEAVALQAQFAGLSNVPMGEEKVLKIMAQQSWLDQGRSIYVGKCALCHADNGGGLVGPNMTDNHYKNTTTLAGMIDVVINGAANGAMPANKTLLNENEIALVTAYVASLRGTFVEGGKEPEGEEITAWPELPTEDEAGM